MHHPELLKFSPSTELEQPPPHEAPPEKSLDADEYSGDQPPPSAHPAEQRLKEQSLQKLSRTGQPQTARVLTVNA